MNWHRTRWGTAWLGGFHTPRREPVTVTYWNHGGHRLLVMVHIKAGCGPFSCNGWTRGTLPESAAHADNPPAGERHYRPDECRVGPETSASPANESWFIWWINNATFTMSEKPAKLVGNKTNPSPSRLLVRTYILKSVVAQADSG